jgi:hypothetical protein
MKKMVAALSSLLALGLSLPLAHARTSAAAGGNPSNAATATCFNVSVGNGSVFNNCGFQTNWEVPTVIDTGGNKVSRISVNVPSTTLTSCRAIGVGEFTTGGTFTGYTAPTAAGVWTSITMSTIFVPTNGFLLIDCQVGPNASLLAANYPS